jgi:hypothetical protein
MPILYSVRVQIPRVGFGVKNRDRNISELDSTSTKEAMGFQTSKSNFDQILLSPNQKVMYRQWLQMVEVYSLKDFTSRYDLLPALSGLAKQMRRQGAGDYLAGLWKGDLICGLLWMIGRKSHCRRDRAGVEDSSLALGLPSWSWISVAMLQSSHSNRPCGV